MYYIKICVNICVMVLCGEAVVTITGTLLLHCEHFYSREPGFPHG